MAAPKQKQSREASSLHFESRDGTKLFGKLYQVEEAVGNALIVHGYADHCGRYAEVAQTINDAGLNALALDVRGHGRSAGARGFINRFEEYLEDVEAALLQLKEHCGDKDVLFVGHSNGALIGLRFLADPFRCPKEIRAAVLSSPFLGLKLKVPLIKTLVGQVASRLIPKLALPNELRSEQLSHDPQKIREHDLDTLCHDVASARWFTEMKHTQTWVAEYAHRITVPSLWVVSGMDEIADPETTCRVHGRIKAEARYHEFPNMHHEVFNEVHRADIFELVGAFCRDKFGL